MDHAPVRGFRHCGRDQRAVPLPAGKRRARPVDGLRPAHPAGHGLRRPACAWRGGSRGRGHRLGGRHVAGVRWHPAERRLDQHDHQRAGRRAAAALPPGGREPGRGRRPAARHHPERHPQGVRGARQLHLPAARQHAPDHRHLRLLRGGDAAVQHHLHQRVPHPRGRIDGRAGGGVHAGRRHRLRAGRRQRGPRRGPLRAAPVVLLQRALQLPGGDRQVPRRPAPVGAHHEGAIRREGRAIHGAALPLADRRQHPHRAAAREQHRARGAAGAVGGVRRRAEHPRKRLRRGAGPAHRALGQAGAPHSAGDRRGDRHHRQRRPHGRRLDDRVAHRRHRGARGGTDRAHRRARRCGGEHRVHAR